MKNNLLNKNLSFKIVDTNVAKGFAILVLLFHHLFANYSDNEFIYYAAQVSKVCVAIFILMSGYGLNETMKNKKVGLCEFYIKRLSKIYLNYWFIAFIFVTYGVLAAGRTFEVVYQDAEILKFIVNMLGIHMYIKPVGFGYNETWWFITLIITLYVMFPFIYMLIQKFPLTFLFVSFVIINFIKIPTLLIWTFPFIAGIYLSKYNGFLKIVDLLREQKINRYVVLVFLIVVLSFFRQYAFDILHTKMDWLLGIILIILIYEMTAYFENLKKFLAFIGIHSFNIFLFHTFIYKYYFHDFIYGFKNPLLIYLALFITSILVSMALEKLKVLIRFEKIYQYILTFKCKEIMYLK